jgi:hypothetical protein
LEYQVPQNIVISVIAYLSNKRGDRVVDALSGVIDDPGTHDLPVRLAEADALLDICGQPTETIRNKADELLREARSNGWPQQIVEQAQQLSDRQSSLTINVLPF